MILLRAYDLAISTSSDADWFACVTGAMADDPRADVLVWVLHAYNRRIDFPAQLRAVVSDQARQPAARIFLEATSYQRALGQQLVAEHPSLRGILHKVEPGASKALRLQLASPLIEAGRVRFARGLDPERERPGTGTGDLVRQLTEFPMVTHDDLMDAFVYLVIGARQMARPGQRLAEVRISTF